MSELNVDQSQRINKSKSTTRINLSQYLPLLITLILGFGIGYFVCGIYNRVDIVRQINAIDVANEKLKVDQSEFEKLLAESQMSATEDQGRITIDKHESLLDKARKEVANFWEEKYDSKPVPPIPEGLLTYEQCIETVVVRDETDFLIDRNTVREQLGLPEL